VGPWLSGGTNGGDGEHHAGVGVFGMCGFCIARCAMVEQRGEKVRWSMDGLYKGFSFVENYFFLLYTESKLTFLKISGFAYYEEQNLGSRFSREKFASDNVPVVHGNSLVGSNIIIITGTNSSSFPCRVDAGAHSCAKLAERWLASIRSRHRAEGKI
jgi:hypothetical protein